MLCTVTDIRGDYAFVKYDQTGVVSEVAIALLPSVGAGVVTLGMYIAMITSVTDMAKERIYE